MLDQASVAGMKLLLEFPAPPGYKSKDPHQTCGEWAHNEAYKAHVTSAISITVDHPALLGWFLCDNCVTQTLAGTWSDNYRCIGMQAQLYNLARESDPWHIYAGAITGLMGWWFSDVGTGFLPPSPGVLSQLVLQLGSQPTTQLSVDLPLMENYPHYFDPGCKEDGCLLGFAKGDGQLTQGLGLDPVANSAS